jgi:hypothetical protein
LLTLAAIVSVGIQSLIAVNQWLACTGMFFGDMVSCSRILPAKALNCAVQEWKSYQAACEHRIFGDETKFVVKWVLAIKAALTPGLYFNRPEDGTVRSFAHAPIALFEIVHREVNMVWIRPRVPGVAISPRIEAREDGTATPEVMAPGRDSNAWLPQDSRVKDCGVLDT